MLGRAKWLGPRPRNNGKPVKDLAKTLLPKEVEQKLIILNYFAVSFWDDF